ncbi:hypothetical protein JYK14_12410 [Siccirubricoccus sp. KC 17139]|uniref:Uncharacterized protein n=1 Tax=Siccirubricoccus soli TaxID=2899147 RepID=A0ABT1D4W7_9PROT|nr:hypothetical protein [Siccirubricoccus soli]MCO6416956.1 hypothetical protein [Siccirubricoccus soli]MCP2683091.1 hypothetical protein [Siccirubricoccus soli]
MTLPIAEDFAAIAARLRDIRAAEQPRTGAAPPQAVPEQYAGFYHWLTGGGAWGPPSVPAAAAEPAEAAG